MMMLCNEFTSKISFSFLKVEFSKSSFKSPNMITLEVVSIDYLMFLLREVKKSESEVLGL